MIPLSAVLAHVESAGRISAVRFEPTVYATLKETDDQTEDNVGGLIRTVKFINQCSPDTARVILASSWGLYQFMGETLYGLGYGQPIVTFWTTKADQDAILSQFLARLGISAVDQADASWLETDMASGLHFATAYNGPGQPDVYLAALRAAYSALNAPVA